MAWLAFALACDGGAPALDSSGPEPSALVGTEAVARRPVVERLETFGTVEFDPERTRTVTVVRAGQVREVAIVPGLKVHQGAVLLTVGPVPEGSPEVQRARIDLEFARQELARIRRLAELHLATNQDVETAAKGVAASRAALDALGAGADGEAETLRAPEDGIVSDVLVTKGSLVQAGQSAVVVAPSDAMAVRTGFEVEDVPRLSEGLEVLVEAVYAGPHEPMAHARLARLHGLADPATQLVEALIVVPTPPEWMVAGARVRVRVILGEAADATSIPRGALLERDGAEGVFVIREDRAHWQPVRIGLRGERRLQVVEGLEAGNLVATTGRSALEDGMKVRTTGTSAGSP